MSELTTTNSDASSVKDANILIVKARFKSSAMNLYGQMLLIIPGENQIDSYNAVISTFSDAYDIELHTGWDKYEEFIADLKWKGHFNASMTTALMNQVTDMTKDNNQVRRFFDSVRNYDYDNLDIVLYDMINRIVREKNLILESVIQEITLPEFNDVRKKRSKPVENRKEQENGVGRNLGRDAVILNVKPLLSPVKGKPVYSLKIGDRVMVKILPGSEKQNSYIKLMDLKDDDQIKAIPGEVVDIKAGTVKNDPVEILTKLDKNLFGKFIEDEKQVKLRMYDPEIDGYASSRSAGGVRFQKTGASRGDTIGLSRGTVIMLSLVLVILIMFIVLLFLSW